MQIDSMNIEQLAELRDRVNARLAERVADRQRELSSEAERLSALVAHKAKPKALKAAPAKLKYQKGENTWSGRGSQPGWVKQHLALGGTLAELQA